MKAITIWQPYASLIAVGIKKYETRTWSTNYRSMLLIHSAKKSPGFYLSSLWKCVHAMSGREAICDASTLLLVDYRDRGFGRLPRDC